MKPIYPDIDMSEEDQHGYSEIKIMTHLRFLRNNKWYLRRFTMEFRLVAALKEAKFEVIHRFHSEAYRIMVLAIIPSDIKSLKESSSGIQVITIDENQECEEERVLNLP